MICEHRRLVNGSIWASLNMNFLFSPRHNLFSHPPMLAARAAVKRVGDEISDLWAQEASQSTIKLRNLLEYIICFLLLIELNVILTTVVSFEFDTSCSDHIDRPG